MVCEKPFRGMDRALGSALYLEIIVLRCLGRDSDLVSAENRIQTAYACRNAVTRWNISIYIGRLLTLA